MTRIGRYSISRPEHADLTSKHIMTFAEILGMGDPRSIRIIDATAGIGGNTLSFLKFFHSVIAVERQQEHFEALKINLQCYGHTSSDKLRLINADYTHVYKELKGDVVFLDLPWNNDEVWYSKKRDLMLYLTDIPLYMLVSNIFRQTDCKLVVCKVPYNFNFGMFIRRIACDLIIKNAKVHSYYVMLIHKSL